MGGFKGCSKNRPSKNSRVSLPQDEKTSKKMADGFRNVDIHSLPNREEHILVSRIQLIWFAYDN